MVINKRFRMGHEQSALKTYFGHYNELKNWLNFISCLCPKELVLKTKVCYQFLEYRRTPSKRTGCNAKMNSPAADRTCAFTRGDAFTRAGGAKLNKLSA